MSLPTQTKVLRAIQEGEIQRVGGTETIKISVRLLAATNKDLESMVAERLFREDLFYRLNVFRIRLPALRERREDIPLLVDYMLQRVTAGRKLRARRLSSEALDLLIRHDWPGNVRELENVILRAGVLAKGEAILAKDLPAELLEPRRTASSKGSKPDSAAPEPESAEVNLTSLYDALYQKVRTTEAENILSIIEKEMILRALTETRENHLRSSVILGMNRSTLKKRLAEMNHRVT
jgi:two-component system nitrogen regulation response regulator GlnG